MLRFDTVNVIDVEATCYPGNVFPKGETQEIIEIGIAVVDIRRGSITDSLSLPIKNQFSNISSHCTRLTGWTQRELDRVGMPYVDAVRILRDRFDSRNRLWVTQGRADVRYFSKQTRLCQAPYPFGAEHMNIAVLTAILTGHAKELSMENSLRALGIRHTGEYHSALDDATNTARQLLELQRRSSSKQ
jgi:inhibitor of KinA sporulation pathway (predicted exonuclease)